MRVLIAPDKFKGSLTAAEVAESLARGIKAGAELLPLADGGDGSVEAAVYAGFARHGLAAFDGETAVIEVANTCGIALLDGRLDPLGASTFALGTAILDALTLRPTRIVLALGGSASTDGGVGMLAALGARFLSADGSVLQPNGGALDRIARVDLSQFVDLAGIELICATDVDNPLTGPRGAAAVFAPQKGATVDEVRGFDDGLSSLVAVMRDAGFEGADAAASALGSGAAGGTGFACLLLGATIVSGADYFLDLLEFDDRVDGCDLVVTGEGSLDEQTAGGKLVSVVARRAGQVPVIAAVGRSLVSAEFAREMGLDRVFALSDYSTLDSSRDPVLSARLLEQIGREIAASAG